MGQGPIAVVGGKQRVPTVDDVANALARIV
jgi:hypothetical protein